jgi:hypothetical protein
MKGMLIELVAPSYRRAAGAVAVIDPENTGFLRLARDRYAAQQQQARHRGSK